MIAFVPEDTLKYIFSYGNVWILKTIHWNMLHDVLLIALGQHWFCGNGLVLSSHKPLPVPLLIQILSLYVISIVITIILSTDFAFWITDWTCCHGPHLHAILRIISRGVSGLATDSPCGVWGRGWTTCLLHDSPLFGSHFKMRVGM